MSAPAVILASASPRRKQILKNLRVPFEIHLPTCQEALYENDPVATVAVNARRKALSVHDRYQESLIIAADTVVSFNGKVLGKPKSYEEAQEWLLSYAGKSQIVYTALAIHHPEEHEPRLRIEATSVRFKDYSLAIVQEYLDRVQPLDRAGAYDINTLGELIIAEYVGSFSNVMGLPQSVLADHLAAYGYINS